VSVAPYLAAWSTVTFREAGDPCGPVEISY
jgi:hypothetical protein